MSTPSPTPTVPFEPEFVQAITELFEQKIVFNQHIGLKIDEVLPERVKKKKKKSARKRAAKKQAKKATRRKR